MSTSFIEHRFLIEFHACPNSFNLLFVQKNKDNNTIPGRLVTAANDTTCAFQETIDHGSAWSIVNCFVSLQMISPYNNGSATYLAGQSI